MFGGDHTVPDPPYDIATLASVYLLDGGTRAFVVHGEHYYQTRVAFGPVESTMESVTRLSREDGEQFIHEAKRERANSEAVMRENARVKYGRSRAERMRMPELYAEGTLLTRPDSDTWTTAPLCVKRTLVQASWTQCAVPDCIEVLSPRGTGNLESLEEYCRENSKRDEGLNTCCNMVGVHRGVRSGVVEVRGVRFVNLATLETAVASHVPGSSVRLHEIEGPFKPPSASFENRRGILCASVGVASYVVRFAECMAHSPEARSSSGVRCALCGDVDLPDAFKGSLSQVYHYFGSFAVHG